MKNRRIVISGFFVLIVLVAVFFVTRKGPDLSRGIPAVSLASYEQRVAIDALRDMTPEQRANHIRRNFPDLQRKLAVFLRHPSLASQVGSFQRVVRIEYAYVDEIPAARATDGSGNIHDGYIKEDLVARVYLDDCNEPFDVLVRCTNGLFDIPGGLLEPIYTAEIPSLVFVIGKGQSLCTFVDYLTAVELADVFHLPIRRKALGNPVFEPITAAEARDLASETDRFKVQVLVHPGTRFDLEAMTMNGHPPPTN